jgi:hypothetical protein
VTVYLELGVHRCQVPSNALATRLSREWDPTPRPIARIVGEGFPPDSVIAMMDAPEGTAAARVVGVEDLHDEVRSGASSGIEADTDEPEVVQLLVGSHVDRQVPSAALVEDPARARAKVWEVSRVSELVVGIESDVLIVTLGRSRKTQPTQQSDGEDGPSS